MSEAKIVLITGANKGVGYEGVKSLLQSSKPYHVLLGSRSLERGQEAVAKLEKECAGTKNTVEVLELDVASDESIQKAFETVKAKHGHLDVLVNNAGMLKDVEFLRGEATLRESFMDPYNVNVAGAHVTTYTFVPLLLKASEPRLIFVAGQGRFAKAINGETFPGPPKEPGWPKKLPVETIGYRCTKVAMNMLMLDYHFKLLPDGVKVFSFNPGFVATDLGGSRSANEAFGAADPGSAGVLMRSVVEGAMDALTGKLIYKDGQVEGFLKKFCA